MRSRKTPNTDIFHAVGVSVHPIKQVEEGIHACSTSIRFEKCFKTHSETLATKIFLLQAL